MVDRTGANAFQFLTVGGIRRTKPAAGGGGGGGGGGSAVYPAARMHAYWQGSTTFPMSSLEMDNRARFNKQVWTNPGVGYLASDFNAAIAGVKARNPNAEIYLYCCPEQWYTLRSSTQPGIGRTLWDYIDNNKFWAYGLFSQAATIPTLGNLNRVNVTPHRKGSDGLYLVQKIAHLWLIESGITGMAGLMCDNMQDSWSYGYDSRETGTTTYGGRSTQLIADTIAGWRTLVDYVHSLGFKLIANGPSWWFQEYTQHFSTGNQRANMVGIADGGIIERLVGEYQSGQAVSLGRVFFVAGTLPSLSNSKTYPGNAAIASQPANGTLAQTTFGGWMKNSAGNNIYTAGSASPACERAHGEWMRQGSEMIDADAVIVQNKVTKPTRFNGTSGLWQWADRHTRYGMLEPIVMWDYGTGPIMQEATPSVTGQACDFDELRITWGTPVTGNLGMASYAVNYGGGVGAGYSNGVHLRVFEGAAWGKTLVWCNPAGNGTQTIALPASGGINNGWQRLGSSQIGATPQANSNDGSVIGTQLTCAEHDGGVLIPQGGGAGGGGGSAFPFSATTLASVQSQLLTANTIPVRFKNFLDATIANPVNDQAPGWYFALAYACDKTTYSSYGDFVTAVGGAYNSNSNASDSPGLVGSIDAYIDAQNTITNAYTGSGALPQWCSDNFYNTRNLYVDMAIVYACCKDKMSSGLKTKVITFLDRGLTQANSSTPLCNGHAINPSYAWKEAGGGAQPYDNYMYGHMKAFSTAYYCLGADSANQATYYDVFRNQMWSGSVKPALAALDGAGLEGTGYGAAEFDLYWCLEMWYQATGEDLFADLPTFWAKKLSAWAHFVTPDMAYLMNYGDHARVSISGMYDYNRMLALPLLTHFPTLTESKATKALFNSATSPEDGGASLATTNHSLNCGWDLMYPLTGVTASAVTDFGNYRKDAAAGYAAFRTGWTSSDTAVFFSYGRKTQDHDHADKGSFTVYCKSWIAYDQNINTHSGEDFDPDVVNFVAMLNGSTLVSQNQGSGTKPTVLFTEDGTPGYFYHSVDFSVLWASPVTGYKRDIVFFPKGTGGVVVIYDHIVSSSAINKRWQMNTPYVPSLSTTSYANDTATISANGSVTAKVQLIESGSTGFTIATTWNAGSDISQNYTGGALTIGRRLDCQLSANTVNYLTVIDIGGQLTSAVAPGNTGTLHKVNLTFTDASTKNLSFDELANHVVVV